MHSCIYKLYPEVQSVVHVHPRFIVLLTTLGQPTKPMCQEGIQLVRQPLPMYPHVKTIQTDAEGMEVAMLLKGDNALLLRGHGTTTGGKDLEEAVMHMRQLEEQARMNYYALGALGPNYPSIPDALIAEMSGRTLLAELPHFKDPISRAAEEPRVDGV
jgi:ribulose-5-phosphate 4-epimerase/fuculose-1-phosphate aldolase